MVGSLSDEIRELERQQEKLPSDLDDRYRALLVEKEQFLRAGDGPNARELDELADRITDAASQSREIAEAVAAGHGALDALQVVDRALQSASSWGTFDLLGGGLFATMVKQGKLRDARSAAASAGSYLRGFGRELRDVQLRHSDLTVDLSEFATLADYFFDGLIIDWFVQKRIREAVDRVTAMTDEVEGLLEVLWERGRQNAANLERLEQRRSELLG